MTNSKIIYSYIPPHYQEVIVKGFNQFDEDFNNIVNFYHLEESRTISKPLSKQLLYIITIQYLFGIEYGTSYSVISSERAPIIKERISKIRGKFISRSYSVKYAPTFTKAIIPMFLKLVAKFQDFFYTTIGENARNQFKKIFQNSKQKFVAPPEVFFGLILPSNIFPKIDVFKRGKILPYFNTLIYKEINLISSISELDGNLKKIDYENNQYSYKIAGKLGFINRPPGYHKLRENIADIESKLGIYESKIDELLVKYEVQDLTCVSVDCCNVPVDERDTTASKGSGSKGPFFGHKTSIGAGSFCLPINSVTANGNSADISLYRDTMLPIICLAQSTGQDIWVQTADAAYTSTYLNDDIIKSNSIPFIDINPRASKYLKELKDATKNLQKLSKKAIKMGLTLAERKAWVFEAQQISEQRGQQLTYDEKKEKLPPILRKWAAKARYHGLTPSEQTQEKHLRKEIAQKRRNIRVSGTWCDQNIGLGVIMQGTIEWFLVYHIRGQNEGINGIIKKRGSLIGDGQHTTWIIKEKPIRGRVESIIIMEKTIALVYNMITRRKRGCLCRIYNWHKKHIFIVFCLEVFVV